MVINGHIVNIDLAIHEIALEYAKMDFQTNSDADLMRPQECLDIMFESYLRAFGYLSEKSEDYVKSQLENH